MAAEWRACDAQCRAMKRRSAPAKENCCDHQLVVMHTFFVDEVDDACVAALTVLVDGCSASRRDVGCSVGGGARLFADGRWALVGSAKLAPPVDDADEAFMCSRAASLFVAGVMSA